jgi:hypothetical protein
VRLSRSEIWEPDILVQEKFIATQTRRVPVQPEKALLFAVLAEAIETFKKYAFTSSAHGRALFIDADNWFHEEDNSENLFSFGNICGLLGLSPGYIRRGLSQLSATGNRVAGEQMVKNRPGHAYRRKTPAPKRYTRVQCRSPRLKGGWV